MPLMAVPFAALRGGQNDPILPCLRLICSPPSCTVPLRSFRHSRTFLERAFATRNIEWSSPSCSSKLLMVQIYYGFPIGIWLSNAMFPVDRSCDKPSSPLQLVLLSLSRSKSTTERHCREAFGIFLGIRSYASWLRHQPGTKSSMPRSVMVPP